MPSNNPHPTAANHYRSLQVLRQQHTRIHETVAALEHGGSTLEAKQAIARIIAALAMVQAEIR